MKLSTTNGQTTLILKESEVETFLRTVNSPDGETLKAHKERLGNLLDPVLQGQKIDYIKVKPDTVGRGEMLDRMFRFQFNYTYDKGKRSVTNLIEYISAPALNRLIMKIPDLRKFLRGDFEQVMEHLENTASQYRTRQRNAQLQYGIESEAEKRGLIEASRYDKELFPPPGYPLAKYGSRRSRITRSRPVRRTRKSKVTLRSVGLKVRVFGRK
jgi:hypothetical protein